MFHVEHFVIALLYVHISIMRKLPLPAWTYGRKERFGERCSPSPFARDPGLSLSMTLEGKIDRGRPGPHLLPCCILTAARGERMEKSDWMPVFSVIEATRTVRAAHPTEATKKPPETEVQEENFWQRIGTAFATTDGGFTILLNAFPLNGKLVVRPPKPGEGIDPRRQG